MLEELIKNIEISIAKWAAPNLPQEPDIMLALTALATLQFLTLLVRRTQYKLLKKDYLDDKQTFNEKIRDLKKEHVDAIEQLTRDHEKVLAPYKPIQDIDQKITQGENELTEITDKVSQTRASYREKKKLLDKLKKEVAIYDSRLALAELGVYEPHFDFADSDAYKAAITEIRNDQKALVKGESAVLCAQNWTVDGSAAKGKTMANRAIKLTLRAFNNECDAAIASVKWNNVVAIEKRIERARSAVDNLNKSILVSITDKYFKAKLKELRLTHEYRERLKTERDERAEIARQERDEKRLQKEAVAALKEEERYEAMLAQARAEVGADDPETHRAKIEELETQLAQAHSRTERAQALAEKTKTGFVYVISNIGSFGEDIVKIGMTRRLDPMDRVKELGDASVPFLFDTHAMIYSDDAPALESALHKEFEDRRVNAANMRKEFFSASVSEVEDAVRRLAPNADFHTDIEAQEFFETLAKRKELQSRLQRAEVVFADDI